MKNKKIETAQLLEKFYEGDSTPEEECFLAGYFLTEDGLDERWQADRQLFHLLYDERIQVPDGVSRRLADAIRQMEAPRNKKSHRKSGWYRIGSAAAVGLLCIGLFFMTRPEKPLTADTFSDPEEAALVAGQALAFMSTQLNKGLNRVAGADAEFEIADQVLNKYFKE